MTGRIRSRSASAMDASSWRSLDGYHGRALLKPSSPASSATLLAASNRDGAGEDRSKPFDILPRHGRLLPRNLGGARRRKIDHSRTVASPRYPAAIACAPRVCRSRRKSYGGLSVQSERLSLRIDRALFAGRPPSRDDAAPRTVLPQMAVALDAGRLESRPRSLSMAAHVPERHNLVPGALAANKKGPHPEGCGPAFLVHDYSPGGARVSCSGSKMTLRSPSSTTPRSCRSKPAFAPMSIMRWAARRGAKM